MASIRCVYFKEPLKALKPCGNSLPHPGLMVKLRIFRNPIKVATPLCKGYATASNLGNSAKASRRQVTVVNDDGRVQWQDLSTREKAARTTQQTFNMGLVLTGIVGTVWDPDIVSPLRTNLMIYRV